MDFTRTGPNRNAIPEYRTLVLERNGMKRSFIEQGIVVLRENLFIKCPKIRRLVTRIMYGNGERTVRLAGVDFVVDVVRENGYLRAARLASRSQFLSRELDVVQICCVISSGVDIFLDVGANVGTVSGCVKHALSRSGRAIRVIAFEAHPDTFSRLKKNADAIGFDCSNIAISDKPGSLDFADGAVSHVFTSIDHASQYNIEDEVITVDTDTLDALTPIEGSIAIKIDVEGQEANVIRGGLGLIKSGRVKYIYFDGLKDPSILGELRAAGYRCCDTVTGEDVTDQSFGILASLDS